MSLAEHSKFFGAPEKIIPTKVHNGDIIQFSYKSALRYVLVLEANADGMLHGMTLDVLSRVGALQLRNMLSTMSSRNVYESYIKLQSGFKENNAYRKYVINDMIDVERIHYTLSNF